MSELADEVAAVVAPRRMRLHRVRQETARWRRADAAVEDLQGALTELGDHPLTPRCLVGQLERLRTGAARLSITRAIELLQRLETQLSRGTVVVGVSGAAQAGKSTLLQAISGLTDAQLPTGAAAAVTAVPSRICHAPHRRRAVLTLHSFGSFRTAELEPRYLRAQLGAAPTTVDAFRAASLPDTGEPAVVELRMMRDALWSYAGLLDRPDRRLELNGDELDRLAEYLSFPEPAPDGSPPHKYLAVRHARIECPFPRAEHGAIELLDLPGISTAELGRQRYGYIWPELDALLVVTRGADSADGSGADGWVTADDDHYLPATADRNTLVLLVRNTSGREGRRRDTVHAVGPPVLAVDGTRPGDVSTWLVAPLLRYLAGNLPRRDEDRYARTRALNRPAWDELVGLAAEVKAVLAQVPPMTRSTAEELYRRLDGLSADVSATLRRLRAGLRTRAAEDEAGVRETILGTHARLLSWARDGLGEGRERWCAEALRRTARDRTSGPFAAAQLARVRTEISGQHATALDQHLAGSLRWMWTSLAGAVGEHLGALLPDRSGESALIHLAELTRRPSEPLPALSAAIADLLAIRLDYYHRFHPLVWFEADPLLDPVAEEPPSREGAERLLQTVIARAERTAERVRVRLLEEAHLPHQVLCAAVTRFADAVLDSEEVRQEIRRLARSYRGDLWRDMLPELDGADARVIRVAQAADRLLAATTEWLGPNGRAEDSSGVGCGPSGQQD